jgi:hypothetical protein
MSVIAANPLKEGRDSLTESFGESNRPNWDIHVIRVR